MFEAAERIFDDQARLRDGISPQWQVSLWENYHLIKVTLGSSNLRTIEI